MSDQDQIEALRAKRAEVEARREAAAKAKEESTAFARETRALADAEALEAAEIKHGAENIATVQTDEGLIIVKRPAQATYRKFQDVGKTDCESLDKLVQPCLVHPEKVEYRRILDVLPHAGTLAANRVLELSGAKASGKG